ncbi:MULTISPECIES: YdiY family protein [unclassified Halobacteriovorax]|uniref:DUF481 domain-containing protein n=1 Tax=unclassified Halobacteriovorax TaxID=2639665 RepID=UPI000CD2518C|nr:DUF481 domain-containing protein [Halobacteriovorax sp. DA5]POB14080.1 hypothetical protein C0Z22_08450 [Halobacteriovorax sp. DA5]
MKKLLFLALIVGQFTHAQFKSEDEVTFIASGGNTNKKTYDFASRNSYKWDTNTLTFNGTYSYGESDEIVDDEKWSALLRLDHVLSKNVDIYLGDLFESDRFKGFWARNNMEIGFKYKFYDQDDYKMFAELGYRYTRENFVQNEPDSHEQKLRAYYEISKELRKGVNARYWLEYIPSLKNSENYIINMEPSIRMLINSTFSLKAGVIWEYENEPVEGRDQHDYKTTISLLANF